MAKLNSSSGAALSALLLTTWTFGAAAEQPASDSTPTTTTTTVDPAPTTTTVDPAPTTTTTVEPATSTTTTTPAVQHPVVAVGTEQKTLPNTPLLVTGTVILGMTYGASAVTAAISDAEWDDKLYYPVAGPWLALDERDCNAQRCKNEVLDTTLLIGSGILQGVGALGMVMSLFIPDTTTQSWYLIGNEDFTVTPLAGAGEVGAVARGRF